MQITVRVSLGHLVTMAALAAVPMLVWWATPAQSQAATPPALGDYAFLARAGNPVDALAASAVAGQLGAPVYLSGTDRLDEEAAQGLVSTAPQVVILAGGTNALSPTVAQQVAELLPDAEVRRIGGAGRTETARLLNEVPRELGLIRPVVAGGTVAGDVGVDGALTVAGTDVGATLAALTARVDGLETDLAAAQERIDSLEATLAGVSRDGDTLTLSGMNVQLVNGEGSTSAMNGLGNLIVGYNQQAEPAAARTGSHYLIVGDRNEWTSYGGIVAGLLNTSSGPYATVTGGRDNTASRSYAAVSGGQSGTASGFGAAVSGGFGNIASGSQSMVGGGELNEATGRYATVSGGEQNRAQAEAASVSGGFLNAASGHWSAIAGGYLNVTDGVLTAVAGGVGGSVPDDYDSRIGNTDFPDSLFG